jgi:hypothetical protein
MELDGEGSVSGRCCELSLGVWVAVSVASGPGRKMFGFNTVASKTVHGRVAVVHHGAGQGWRHIMHATPCRRVCIAVQEELCV